MIRWDGIGSSEISVFFENPEFSNIFLNSAKVYASPDGVAASMTTANIAEVGGDIRSSLGTNSTVTILPPSTRDASSLRMNVSHVSTSKWWKKFGTRMAS